MFKCFGSNCSSKKEVNPGLEEKVRNEIKLLCPNEFDSPESNKNCDNLLTSANNTFEQMESKTPEEKAQLLSFLLNTSIPRYKKAITLGGRKSRKSKKSRKGKKSRKYRKYRKSRK